MLTREDFSRKILGRGFRRGQTLWTRRLPAFLASLLLLLGSAGALLTTLIAHSNNAHAAAAANQAVTTYKYNNAHSGSDANETTLTTANVNTATFGKRVTYPVDGQVYAQPLYLPNLTIGGAVHNVAFIETENDSIYAFDADATTAGAPLWHDSFLSAGVTPVPYTLLACADLQPASGITGTPVIDSTTNTMYVVVYTYENSTPVYRLHALNVTTGQERAGSPTILQGSVTGTGSGQVGGKIVFDPLKERQRGALVFSNGQLYIPFGSFCDIGPYHGWIMSYSYSNSQFQQTAIYNNTANGAGSGIWGGGGPLVADTNGNIYLMSGNGDFDLNTGGVDAGDVFARLNAQLQLQDYFAPFNQYCLNTTDADLGSGGPLLVPGQNELIGGSKEGRFYVVNAANMGKYTIDPNLGTACAPAELQRTDVDKITEEFAPGTVGGIYSTPSYWKTPTAQYIYLGGSGSPTKAFQLQANGLLSTAPTSQTSESFGFTGGNTVVSGNGTSNGILWLIDNNAVLRAYDATNLANELYNSNQNVARDGLDSYEKFTLPIVANGEVFVGTTDNLTIYGLNPSASTTTPTPIATATPPTGVAYNNVGISDNTMPTSANFDYAGNSYSSATLQAAGINPGDNTFFQNMVFTWPNVVPGQADNYVVAGQKLRVTPVAQANVLGFLGSATGGTGSGTATITYTDGSTQTFTLSFSDWTSNGALAPGTQVMAQMPYRNTPGGQQTVNTYLYYASVNMQAGKTIQSVTLPATSTGGALHVFTVSTKNLPTITTAAYNNVGVSADSQPSAGNFDGANSYSSQALSQVGITTGGNVSFGGLNFTWPSATPGTANDYVSNGQVLPLSGDEDNTTLGILGSASGGNASGTGTITYANGDTQIFTLGFGDWTRGGAGTDPLVFGNQLVATTTYRNTPTGQQQTSHPSVFFAQVTLTVGESPQSLTLPSTVTGGQLHVFSIATGTGSGTVTPPPPPVAYNNTAISDDSQPSAGSFDGANSYSAEALGKVNITPGGSVTFGGTTFTWPAVNAGSPDDYVVNGQVLSVVPVNGATTLAFLGASANGPTSGIATITYTDGTSQPFTLGFSDWTLGGGGNAPSFGNQIVATTGYRNTPTGQQSDKPVVLYASIVLSAGKTIQSVTLPSSTTGGQMHVFAVATK